MGSLGKAEVRVREALRRRRTAITGIGLVTPFGVGVEAYWRSVLGGVSGVCGVTHFDPSGLPCRFAGFLKDTNSSLDFTNPGSCVGEPRFVLFALAASRMASEDSGWMGNVEPERVGVYLGTSGEKVSLAQRAEIAYEARSGDGEINPRDYFRVWGTRINGAPQRLLPQYATMMTAWELGALGPVMTINTACTSSAPQTTTGNPYAARVLCYRRARCDELRPGLRKRRAVYRLLDRIVSAHPRHADHKRAGRLFPIQAGAAILRSAK
ncbi:MAG: hypothetical protein IH919_06605 [Deltaproteobacteria bacterium]|nr:hypothetical protein [Deltaproteobacteria bacterium]